MHSNNKPRNKTNSKNIARTFLLSNRVREIIHKNFSAAFKKESKRLTRTNAFFRQTFCFYGKKMLLSNYELLLKTLIKLPTILSIIFPFA